MIVKVNLTDIRCVVCVCPMIVVAARIRLDFLFLISREGKRTKNRKENHANVILLNTLFLLLMDFPMGREGIIWVERFASLVSQSASYPFLFFFQCSILVCYWKYCSVLGLNYQPLISLFLFHSAAFIKIFREGSVKICPKPPPQQEKKDKERMLLHKRELSSIEHQNSINRILLSCHTLLKCWHFIQYPLVPAIDLTNSSYSSSSFLIVDASRCLSTVL